MKNNHIHPARQLVLAGLALLAVASAARGDGDTDAGRYLVTIAGCNDCHTPGWMETGGGTPEEDWLTGTPIGWRGPWGTTYPSNLRLLVQDIDEDAWVTMLQTRKDRPPMPWMGVNKFSEADSRAVYRYIRALGKAGERMPAYVAPGVEPTTPYFSMEPLHMERLQPAPAVTQSGG